MLDTPLPFAEPDQVLIRVKYSLISAGTELSAIKAGGLVGRSITNKTVVKTIVSKVRDEDSINSDLDDWEKVHQVISLI